MSFRGLVSLGRVVIASRQAAQAQAPRGLRCLSSATEIESTFGIYGGWKVPYTVKPEVAHPSDDPVRSAYRVLKGDGVLVDGAVEPEMDKELAVELMTLMIRLETMDQVFYDAQRQGRMSFYMTSAGEEAITIGTSSALSPQDMVFAQYREAGVLMYRGFTLQNFADQCFSNADDKGKGRQMPVHYGTKELNYQTISSPLGTQLPQAVGAAYKYKVTGEDRIGACYFGEGAASEGDFHAALNFAATLKAPVLFICRNNGYAISTPSEEQFKGDGIVSRASGYGMASMRVDGNDMLAVVEATKMARAHVFETKEPLLLEFMTYRQGHHSTSDDSTRYREVDEILSWKEKTHPIDRFRSYMTNKDWWSAEQEATLRANERTDVLKAMVTAEEKEKPEALADLFEDVYDEVPPNLVRQREELKAQIEKYPDHYTLSDGH